METVLSIVSENLPLIISGVLVPLVSWFIKKKVDNEKAQHLLLELNDAVGTAVAATAQVYVREIRKARAGGKLTDEEKKNARGTAIREAKRLLSNKLRKELRKRCGDENSALETYIEAEVANRNRLTP